MSINGMNKIYREDRAPRNPRGWAVRGPFRGLVRRRPLHRTSTHILRSEDAMEHDEIHQFLRTKDNWDSELAFSIDPSIPSVPPAEGSAEGGFTGGTVHHQKPIGVPGALPPSQMTKPSLLGPKTGASPRRTKEELAKDRERDKNRFDVSEELSGYGLQGVKVTHDELDDLVKELEAELGNWGSGKKKTKAPSKVEDVKEGGKEDVKEEVKGEEVKKADKEEEANEEDASKETDEKEKSETKEAVASSEETKPEAKPETADPSPEAAK
jgi:SH3 domain-binding glutamic acid-rich protein